jgi:hypothetical protein
MRAQAISPGTFSTQEAAIVSSTYMFAHIPLLLNSQRIALDTTAKAAGIAVQPNTPHINNSTRAPITSIEKNCIWSGRNERSVKAPLKSIFQITMSDHGLWGDFAFKAKMSAMIVLMVGSVIVPNHTSAVSFTCFPFNFVFWFVVLLELKMGRPWGFPVFTAQ